MSTSIYARVTADIIAELERGTVPWVRPWSTAAEPLPRNVVSQQHYRGINLLVLSMQSFAHGYASNQWLTFRQALKLGGCVRKGEKATAIVYYRPLERDPETETQDPPRRAVVRTSAVFNLEQVAGLDHLSENQTVTECVWKADEQAESILQRSGAVICHQGWRAYYAPTRDQIYLPVKSSFENRDGYYSTALHELVHWSGHRSRLNRALNRRFGSESYAAEELIAEVGAAFLCAHCRIDATLQHAAYIESWLRVLRQDTRAIFTAAAQAQKAADFLLANAAPQPVAASAA